MHAVVHAQVIAELDDKKREALHKTWIKVNEDFGSIFSTLLPGTSAKLEPPEGQTYLAGGCSLLRCLRLALLPCLRSHSCILGRRASVHGRTLLCCKWAVLIHSSCASSASGLVPSQAALPCLSTSGSA